MQFTSEQHGLETRREKEREVNQHQAGDGNRYILDTEWNSITVESMFVK